MKSNDGKTMFRMKVEYLFEVMTHARFVMHLKNNNASDEEIIASLVCNHKLPKSYAIRADLALEIARDWKKKGGY